METLRPKEIKWLPKVTHPSRVTEPYLDTGNVTPESPYRWTGLQGRNRDTDVENKHMDTKGGKQGLGGGGGMNWEIGIDMYTLICIK